MLTILIAASIVAGSQVRSTDPVIGAALDKGLIQSEVIRRLVDVIDKSNVFVYLARGDCPRPAIACLMMAGGGSGVRYVRINFRLPIGLGTAGGWHSEDLSVALAHELQHAAEIAGWPEVVDGETLQAAYRRRGLDRRGTHLDTDAAARAGDSRRVELGDRRRFTRP